LPIAKTQALWIIKNPVFATWTNTAYPKDTVCGDKAGARIDLGSYLTDETSLEWAIDAPGRLSFTVSNGHLFDPNNSNSLLRTYLAKGKGVVVRMGERIDGVDEWADQGTYIVNGQRMQYKRGEYPSMQIECADIRSLWVDHQVVAVNLASIDVEEALVDVITENTGILDENIIVPTIPLAFDFDAQWLDSPLGDIVDEIANRFQHFCTVNHDNTVTFRPITTTAAASNIYSLAQIIEFSPDDSYSDLTNRITVTGLSLNDFQVSYNEERLGAINGTIGWYGFKKDYPVYYSEDRSKMARQPRLEVIETSTSILFKLAGKITERISEEDPDFRYCVVEVKAPNLVPLLIAAIGMYAAGNLIGDGTLSIGGGYTIPIGRKIEGAGMLLALMVLGSIGNFQYEVWGNPIGYVKRSFSASADDLELQHELGQVVENKFEGFLCQTQTHCKTVADFELMVAKAQRNRVKITKIAHLQDEIGDTVAVPHPYTNQEKRVFVTNISRKYKPASTDGDGYVYDEIEGWAL